MADIGARLRFFQEREDDRKVFHDNMAQDMDAFLAAASDEAKRMWAEKLEDKERFDAEAAATAAESGTGALKR